jgi:NADH dehydrogenase
MQEEIKARQWLTTFIIIGGGFSGVEVAGEINDFLHASGKYYPSIASQDYKVILIHSGDHLLQEVAPRLGQIAAKKMRAAGIDVRLNTRVAKVDDQSVELDSGERLYGGTVVCSIGTTPDSLVDELDLPKQRGRITTLPDMSVADHSGIWALGDCAVVPNAYDNKLCPPTAQCAVRQARQLADNIFRSLRGQATRPCHYHSLGQLSSIGHNKAVAEMFGMRLSGFIAWLLWRGVYLLKIPTFARKVRLFVAWSWEMFFPVDIAHLRFTRSARNKRPRRSERAA